MRIKTMCITLLAIIILLSGCGNKENLMPTASWDPAATPAPTVDPVALTIETFFKDYVDTNQRPIGVMVDNDDDNARPHAGLNEAYLIYEMVVEGGATRFLAFFRDNVEKIGPVRSSRHYFLDYVMENDAIYTHYGWSPQAIKDISAFGIDKINGVLGGDGNAFWREEKYKGDWHSAYTSMQNIKDMATKKGFDTETDTKGSIQYSKTYLNLPAENIAEDISLVYSSFYKTGYHYNQETGMYEKYINGNPHVMQSGAVLEVKNVLVELIGDRSLGDGTDRRQIDTTGSGKGYYFTNGSYIKINWSKPSRKAQTVYTKTDGTPLLVNPGKTIVNIISPSANVSISEIQ